nr:MAG TPA: hypothetical protein [Caudoviricetes sp.]
MGKENISLYPPLQSLRCRYQEKSKAFFNFRGITS